MDSVNYWVAPAISDTHTNEVDDIISRVEEITKIPITTKGRWRSLCEGRQLVAYILHIKYGMSLMSVGELLKIDHSTVSYAVKCVRTLLSLDRKFVARWKDIIDYAQLAQDTHVTEPEILQDESDLPTKCEECMSYNLGTRFCELRMIKCYDSKPISFGCRKYFLRKRV